MKRPFYPTRCHFFLDVNEWDMFEVLRVGVCVVQLLLLVNLLPGPRQGQGRQLEATYLEAGADEGEVKGMFALLSLEGAR